MIEFERVLMRWPCVITHFTVGTAASGAGSVLYRGSMAATRNISAGITPVWNAGTLSGTVD